MTRFSFPSITSSLRVATARRAERRARQMINELDAHILRDIGLEPGRIAAHHKGQL